MNNQDYIVRHQNHNNSIYTIVAVLDEDSDKVDYYEIYDEDGFCINEGNPFYTLPSKEYVKKWINNAEE